MRVFKRSKRSFLPSGSDALEGRLLPSSIAHPMPTPPTPLVAASPHLGREAILTSRTPAHPSDRLAKPRCVTASHAAVSPSVKRWSWLAGSYWYVPSRNLPAVIFDGSKGTLIPVSDQTVFQITGYREGYFWGKSVTELGSSSSVSGKSLVASVTPQGRVLLTFSYDEQRLQLVRDLRIRHHAAEGRPVDHGEPDVPFKFPGFPVRALGVHGANASGSAELEFPARCRHLGPGVPEPGRTGRAQSRSGRESDPRLVFRPRVRREEPATARGSGRPEGLHRAPAARASASASAVRPSWA